MIGPILAMVFIFFGIGMISGKEIAMFNSKQLLAACEKDLPRSKH